MSADLHGFWCLGGWGGGLKSKKNKPLPKIYFLKKKLFGGGLKKVNHLTKMDFLKKEVVLGA